MKPLDMKKVKKGKILGADSLGLLCSYAPPNCTVPFGLVLGMNRLFACLLLEHSNLQYTRFKNKLSPPVRNPLSLGKFISLSHSELKKACGWYSSARNGSNLSSHTESQEG